MARKREKGVKQVQLWQARVVQEVGLEISAAHHSRLAEKQIRYAFSRKQPKAFGRPCAARVEIVGGKAAALAAGLPESEIPQEKDEQFFLVTMGFSWWQGAEPDLRRAVVDEVLCRCGVNDKGNCCLYPPDVITFRQVIERHGLYSHDLKQFGKTVQGVLPLEEAAEPEKPARARVKGANGAHVNGADLDAAQAALDAEPSRVAIDSPTAERLAEEIRRGVVRTLEAQEAAAAA